MMYLKTVPIVDDVFENGTYHVLQHGAIRDNGACDGFENGAHHVFENGAYYVFYSVFDNGANCGFANEAYHVCEKENDQGDGGKDGKKDAKEDAKETQYVYGKEACCYMNKQLAMGWLRLVGSLKS